MVVVGQANAVVLRDDVVVNGQDRLRVHSHPGHLVALEVLHYAGQQGIAANRDGDIGNRLGEARKIRVWKRQAKAKQRYSSFSLPKGHIRPGRENRADALQIFARSLLPGLAALRHIAHTSPATLKRGGSRPY